MDPYLESRWSDVHAKMIGFIGEALQPMLPRDLRARAEERLLLEADADEDAESGTYRSDVAVVETGTGSRKPTPGPAGAAVVDPVVIRRFPTPMLDRWVQIVDVSSGNRVVTAIEILSPWNKQAGRLNRQYLRKLEDYARANVSVVEIDLLRAPHRGRMAVTEADIPAERRPPTSPVFASAGSQKPGEPILCPCGRASRPSRFPCGKPIPKSCSNSSRSSTASTSPGATTILIMANPRNRHCPTPTPHGRQNS